MPDSLTGLIVDLMRLIDTVNQWNQTNQPHDLRMRPCTRRTSIGCKLPEQELKQDRHSTERC